MIPLVAPCITKRDRKYMVDRVTDGLLEDESEVRRFEEAFAARVGTEWAVAVNSGTSALIVALRAAELLGEVAIPSWSCVALRNAVKDVVMDHLSDYSPRYLDTRWDVRNATAYLHTERVDSGAIVAHMFGQITHSNAVIPEIEDWTLSLGATPSLLLGKIGVCSTNASKMLSTGRGGLVFGNDLESRQYVLELVNYESHASFGYSVGMSSTQAALGVSQLGQLDEFIERRRELAAGYTERFRAAGIDCPDADCGSVFFRYLVAVESPEAAVFSLAERGIEAGRGVYPPLHRLAGLPDEQFPGTTAAVESLLSVPVHPSISDAQAGHIIESVLAVCAP